MSHTPIHCCIIEECCKPASREQAEAVANALLEQHPDTSLAPAARAALAAPLVEMAYAFLQTYKISARHPPEKP